MPAGRACGGLMMAANWSTPNIPRLEMVKVPPVISSGFSLLSLACSTGSVEPIVAMCQTHVV